MKVRNGFVSNSSTSSFLIYGTMMNYSKVEDLLVEKYDDNVYNVLDKEGLEQFCETDFGDVVGVSFARIGEDETPRQFKERVKAKLEEVFGMPIECDFYDGTYPC